MSSVKEYLRFDRPQRVEHWALMISFTVLAFTGIPQKFAGDGWAESIIGAFGGIENTRFLHHAAAAILLLVGVYHFVELFYRVLVQRVRWTMFPQLQDVFDAFNTLLYNLGVRKESPRLEHFSFAEKFEYWALVWGTIIMALTGFLLWNPIISSRFFPGDMIPAAKAAHGGEAILAVLAILTWHFYNVHLKTFNKSMFLGWMDEHAMQEEHGLELVRIQQGGIRKGPTPEKLLRRQRVYLPIAVVLGLVLIFGVYLFVSAESTAVTTLPIRVTAQVYVPQTPTPTLPPPTPTSVQPTLASGTLEATPEGGTPSAATPQPTNPPVAGVPKALPADHAGRTVCTACHSSGVGGAPKSPADHAGRLDAACLDCHKPQ